LNSNIAGRLDRGARFLFPVLADFFRTIPDTLHVSAATKISTRSCAARRAKVS
jgi:hypothetical protein